VAQEAAPADDLLGALEVGGVGGQGQQREGGAGEQGCQTVLHDVSLFGVFAPETLPARPGGQASPGDLLISIRI
jgi:hypothetical protein